MLSLVLEWLKEKGGLDAIEKRNREKAGILYNAIDESGGFYRGHAREDSRSNMNVTFTLKNDELTASFIAKAKEEKCQGLADTVRSVAAALRFTMPYQSKTAKSWLPL